FGLSRGRSPRAHRSGARGRGECATGFLGEVYPLQSRGASRFSTALSMQQSRKSIATRFRLSATGKLVRRTPALRHLLATKSSKQKRRASRDKLVAEGHAKPLKRALPFGL